MGKRLIDKITGGYIPYNHHTEESAITPRQKKILKLVNQVRHVDNLAENYLHRFLRKRRKIIKQIREVE